MYAINVKDKPANRVHLVGMDGCAVAICHLSTDYSVEYLLGADNSNYSNCLWIDGNLFVPEGMFEIKYEKNGGACIVNTLLGILVGCTVEQPEQFTAHNAIITNGNPQRIMTLSTAIRELYSGSSPDFAAPAFSNSGPTQPLVYSLPPVGRDDGVRPISPEMTGQQAAFSFNLSPPQVVGAYSYASNSKILSPPNQYLTHTCSTTAQSQSIHTPKIPANANDDDPQFLRREICKLNDKINKLTEERKTHNAHAGSNKKPDSEPVRYDAFMGTLGLFRQELEDTNDRVKLQIKKEIESLKEELKNPNNGLLSQQRPTELTRNNGDTQALEDKIQHVSVTGKPPSQVEAVNTSDNVEHSYRNDSSAEINDDDQSACAILPTTSNDSEPKGTVQHLITQTPEEYHVDQPSNAGSPTADDNSEPEALRQHLVTETPKTQTEETPKTTQPVFKKKKRTIKKDKPNAAGAVRETFAASSLEKPGDKTTSFHALGFQCKKTILQYPRTIVTSAMITTLLVSCYVADIDLPSVFFYLLSHFYEMGMAYASYNVQNGMALAQEYFLPPVVGVLGTVGTFFAAINCNCANTQKVLTEHHGLLLSPITKLYPSDDPSQGCPELDYLRQQGVVPYFSEVDWRTFQKPAPKGSYIAIEHGQVDLSKISCKRLKKLNHLLRVIGGAKGKKLQKILKQCGIVSNDSWAEFCYAYIGKLMPSGNPISHYVQQLMKLQKQSKNNGHQPFQISARRVLGFAHDSELFYGVTLCCQIRDECSLPPGTDDGFYRGAISTEVGKIDFDLPYQEKIVYSLEKFHPSKHGGTWEHIAKFCKRRSLRIHHAPKTGIYRVMDPRTNSAIAVYCFINGEVSSYFF
ncbi:hypothetical protein [Candidatus Sororendozoicomonas aggregata]|uniref:hypothetical protein n=1 Tax=Candidatus Sororendozoicomonas aggregata TaxID=3073239 RepID=UPI002ED296E4